VPPKAEHVANDDATTILDLYKTAVEMADRVSARRAGANSFFLTLNTMLAAAVGIVSSARKPPPHGNVPTFDAFGLVVTVVAGVVLALVWRSLLKYYRRLNGAKFDVINKLEESLPARPFTVEWEILHPDESLAGADAEVQWWRVWKMLAAWRRKTKHREATIIEQVVPIDFMLIYVALGLRVIFQ
jgi:hypothetical protein